MSAAQAPEVKYSREPQVEAEILRLKAVPRARVASEADGAEPAREETLVHMVRLCRREGDDRCAAALVRVLVRRVTKKVARTLKLWRLGESQGASDEAIEAFLIDFYEQIFSADDSAGFWEVRFWVCLERRLMNIVRRLRGELDRETVLPHEPLEEGDEPEEDQPAASGWDADPQMQALVGDALAQLPAEWRTAFVLKHWAGYREESEDGGPEPTIAAIMGVTGRTVRNYLMRAEKRLARWRTGSLHAGSGGQDA